MLVCRMKKLKIDELAAGSSHTLTESEKLNVKTEWIKKGRLNHNEHA